MYGIFAYIWLIFMVNVGKYTSPMDPMGNGLYQDQFFFSENLRAKGTLALVMHCSNNWRWTVLFQGGVQKFCDMFVTCFWWHVFKF